MSRSRTFKKTKIALVGNLPDRDKIPNWIKHAGGSLSVSKFLEDDITHLILSREAWKDYGPMVKEARRKGTIYIMKASWLTDSISINKSRLLDEAQSKYAWELEHARRVSSKNGRKQQEIRNAKRKAKLDERREQCADGENGDSYSTSTDQMAEREKFLSDKHDLKLKPVKQRTSTVKPKQIIDAGIKLDKDLLESERDMALKRYRPYVGPDGMPYLITLVRHDVARKVKEQYDIKTIKPFSVASSDDTGTEVDFDMGEGAPRMPQRFAVSETTVPHYLEDGSCCTLSHPKTKNLKQKRRLVLDSGLAEISTLRSDKSASTAILQTSFEAWAQHLPFSTNPVMTYDPDLKVEDAYGVTLEPRVHVPQPFAHSLQLYESFDYDEDRRLNTNVLTPTTTNTSFTSYLTQSGPSSKATNLTSIVTSPDRSTSGLSQPKERKYYLLHKYTRKGRGQPEIKTNVLASMDSSWDTAYRVFCKFFKLKTGFSWEQVKRESLPVTNHQEDKPGIIESPESTTDTQNSLLEAPTAQQPTTTLDTTTTLGASFFKSSVQVTSPQKNIFRYIPNAVEDLQEINNAYTERYRENWLPSHAKVKPCASQPNKSSDCRTWAEIVATSKPQFNVCEDRSSVSGHRGGE